MIYNNMILVITYQLVLSVFRIAEVGFGRALAYCGVFYNFSTHCAAVRWT